MSLAVPSSFRRDPALDWVFSLLRLLPEQFRVQENLSEGSVLVVELPKIIHEDR